LPSGALERHLLAALGLEVAAVPAPPRVEVRLVVRQPAEVVVEGPVLHHHHDKGVDREVARRGNAQSALAPRCGGDDRVRIKRQPRPGGEPGTHRGALEELSPRVVSISREGLESLRLKRILNIHQGDDTGAFCLRCKQAVYGG